MKRVFLYKINGTDDRDCCVYIRNNPERFECGHYFGGVILEGCCFSNSSWANYEEIKTVLSKEEYEQLKQFSEDIQTLGYGISKGDERYKKGMELCNGIKQVYDKLNSMENEEMFLEIQEEEKEWLMDEYSLDEEAIKEIFDDYGLEYRDRSIVGSVYDDTSDLGYEEAWSLGYIKNGDTIMERYFDYEQFGEDLANEDENYHKLADGRVVSLNY